jgi:predicted RNase H-like HicB family nuclease
MRNEVAMEYAVVIEEADDGSFSAYVPDVPGCVSCGDSLEEIRNNIGEAIRLHIESLETHGESPGPN